MSPPLKSSRLAGIGVLGLSGVCNKTKRLFSDCCYWKGSFYEENYKPVFQRHGMGRYCSGGLGGSLQAVHYVLGTFKIHRETGRYYFLGDKLLSRSSFNV